jgi:hypothetical protein
VVAGLAKSIVEPPNTPKAPSEETFEEETPAPLGVSTESSIGTGTIVLTTSSRILLLGEGGLGKTYMADKFLRRFRRVLVITTDPTEFSWCPNRVITVDTEKVLVEMEKAFKAGNIMVVIDDADIYFTRFEDDNRLKLLLATGRHRNCGWCIMTRRTQDLPPLCFKQANRVFIFQTDYPNDLALYEDFYMVSAEVKALNRDAHECLFIDRDARTKRVIVA